MHGEFLNGTLDPIGSILLCLVCAIGLVVWLTRSAK
jgi:hypothetical protein